MPRDGMASRMPYAWPLGPMRGAGSDPYSRERLTGLYGDFR